MAITTPAHTARPAAGIPPAVPRLALGVVGVVLAVNAVALGSQVMLSSDDYSEIAGGAPHLAHYAIWTACLVALSQIYPALGGLRGRDGRPISPVVLRVAGVGAALAACTTFVSAFVNAFLADQAPALLDDPPTAILLIPLLGASAAAMVGTAAFGIAGALRRAVPVPAAVLLVLGGLLIPALGPVSNLFVGVGLAWTAWRGSRVPA